MSARTLIRPLDAEGVLFDLDGVLTDTAAVHRRAWTELFAAYLSAAAPDVPPFTDADYFALVDGTSRLDGIRAVLRSRGLALPDGADGDPADAATVNGLGNRKNTAFLQILDRDGVRAFPGSVRLVQALARARVPMAVVSSSKNARVVLERAGLLEYFSVVVDGLVAAQRGIPGKPAPAMFEAAARELGVTPTRSVAIEDAVSGVASAHAGRFWVIGVDRGADAEALRAAGADQVVADLDALGITR